MQPESWKFLCTGRWKHRCGRLCLSRLFSCWDTQGRCSVVCFQTWEEGSCISPVCAYKLLVNHVYKVYKCHTEIVFVLWLLSSPVIIPMSQYVKNTKSQTSIARQLTWSVERWLGCGLGMSTDSLWFAGMPGREGKKERERERYLMELPKISSGEPLATLEILSCSYNICPSPSNTACKKWCSLFKQVFWIQPYGPLFSAEKFFHLPRHTSSWPPVRPVFFRDGSGCSIGGRRACIGFVFLYSWNRWKKMFLGWIGLLDSFNDFFVDVHSLPREQISFAYMFLLILGSNTTN